MNNKKRRVEMVEASLQGNSNAPEVLYEVCVDMARGDEAELFVPFKNGLPIGETVDFPILAKRARKFRIVVNFDVETCAHTPCAPPCKVDDSGAYVSDIRIDDSTRYRWGTFKRGDFLKAYKAYHDAWRDAREQFVAENSERLAAFKNRTDDEWRAILGFSTHAALTCHDHAALRRGDFAALDNNTLIWVVVTCEQAERIAPLIELEKRFPHTWCGDVLHLLSELDHAALMGGRFYHLSDAGIAAIESAMKFKLESLA